LVNESNNNSISLVKVCNLKYEILGLFRNELNFHSKESLKSISNEQKGISIAIAYNDFHEITMKKKIKHKEYKTMNLESIL
jgi:hypothetical protein